jgi:polysaccharide biosynthesis protein PslH
MRLLVITETVPYPLDTGGRIKTWHTIEALAREHEVHCHAFVRTEAQRADALPTLQRVCASVELHLVHRSVGRELAFVLRSLATGLPFTVVRHFDVHAAAVMAAVCRQRGIDAVYADHLSTFEYAIRLGLPIVHDAHNVEHRILERAIEHLGIGPRRLLYAREWRRLRAYEAAMYPRATGIFTVSEVDRQDIAALAGPGVPVSAVPISVGASTFTPLSVVPQTARALFLGTLDWPPNADAVRFFLGEVWPLVRRAVPDAELTIVGRGEAPLVRAFGATPGVRFTGRVPDIEPYVRDSRVMVVPIRSGSGMRVKILDAVARGLPVVTTSVGVEGIEAASGVHLDIADDPEAFAAATCRLLRDDALVRERSQAARALALERYDTGVVGRLQLAALRAWLS